MTRQLLIVAAGVVCLGGLTFSSTAGAAVSPRATEKSVVRKSSSTPARAFGRKRAVPGKRRRGGDTTAAIVPKGSPFQGRPTVGDMPDTVAR